MDAAGSDGGRNAGPGMPVDLFSRQSTKRPSEEDPTGGKKRRKQLKPVRIATNLDSLPSHMVQVPKDDVVSCSEPSSAVPVAKPYRFPLKDVPFENELLGDAASAINVPTPDSGPNYSAFAFPFSYQPQSHWADRTLKIFNQEAYCELCKKEFCNKYFLKTHKANKHGIYNNETSSSSSVRQSVDIIRPISIPPPLENGFKFHESDCEDKNRAFCDLCNKSFCNKYFVRRHKHKTHGFEDLEGELTPVQNKSTNETTSTLIMNEDPTEDPYYDEEEKEEPLNLIVNAESEASSECKPEDCTENLEKLETMLLRLHPNDGDVDQNTDDSNEPEQQMIQLDTETPMISRKQSKPNSSFCEICNKELCNKYFMRTHMQRMHGIELEHGTQIGGVVCNICNKELCSKYFLRVHKQNTHGVPGQSGPPVVRPEVKTPPRPNSFSQVCIICNKRFRSSKWLQAHLQSDHRDEPRLKDFEEASSSNQAEPPLNVISKLLWETNSMSSMFSCSQCAFTTPVLAFLFVHERSHFLNAEENGEMVKPSTALQDLIHNKTFWQHAITQQPSEGLDLSARVPSSSHS